MFRANLNLLNNIFCDSVVLVTNEKRNKHIILHMGNKIKYILIY